MNPEYLQKDKLHPNKKGYTVMADYIIDEANLQRNA
jgi:lysophospholipase L1-like esterase